MPSFIVESIFNTSFAWLLIQLDISCWRADEPILRLSFLTLRRMFGYTLESLETSLCPVQIHIPSRWIPLTKPAVTHSRCGISPPVNTADVIGTKNLQVFFIECPQNFISWQFAFWWTPVWIFSVCLCQQWNLLGLLPSSWSQMWRIVWSERAPYCLHYAWCGRISSCSHIVRDWQQFHELSTFE